MHNFTKAIIGLVSTGALVLVYFNTEIVPGEEVTFLRISIFVVAALCAYPVGFCITHWLSDESDLIDSFVPAMKAYGLVLFVALLVSPFFMLGTFIGLVALGLGHVAHYFIVKNYAELKHRLTPFIFLLMTEVYAVLFALAAYNIIM